MEKKEYRNRIRVILAEKMITNTYLAEQLSVSKMTISRWCANTTQPSAPQLIKISQVLQCDLRDLYETVE
ncbi:helix-turn-helix transcriptional regulator [Parabacteroides sp. ZJ-118]|uniref:helix-turn-helix transcriptional regulator n=1 Tax=Parabacteroides sp. ZJ-118 TaxID=2709398 RepID=UPI0013EBF5D9|nr:helix-turn-helix transcriptional regulator [Parabacteroides sp. ZJ-118]